MFQLISAFSVQIISNFMKQSAERLRLVLTFRIIRVLKYFSREIKPFEGKSMKVGNVCEKSPLQMEEYFDRMLRF
jgi:hypothetical protein